MTRVGVDSNRCTGHGRCYTPAPDVFDADEAGHCVVLVDEVSGEPQAQAVTAERNCPRAPSRWLVEHRAGHGPAIDSR